MIASDADFDRVLSSWMADSGPRRAPDWIAEDAVALVANVDQKRVRWTRPTIQSRANDRRRLLAVALTVLVAVLVVAIGVGVSLRQDTPPPSPSPNGAILRAIDDSFSMRLPPPWAEQDGPDALAVYAEHPDGVQLTVRRGDSWGQITRCDRPAGRWEGCTGVRATTLDELVEALGPYEEVPTTRRTTTLDRAPARLIQVESAEPS